MFYADGCPTLIIENGMIEYSQSPMNGQYPENTVAMFTCNSGFSRLGSSSTKCQKSLNWDQQTPKCKPSKKIKLYM